MQDVGTGRRGRRVQTPGSEVGAAGPHVQHGDGDDSSRGHRAPKLPGAHPGGSRHEEQHSFPFSFPYLHEVTDVNFLWPSAHNVRESGHHAVHRKRYVGSASMIDGGK